MKKHLTIIISTIALITSVASLIYTANITPRPYTVSESNRRSCLDGANRAKEGFKGTEFEDWNFYETCLLNIECANPTRECPTEAIHAYAKFFTEAN